MSLEDKLDALGVKIDALTAALAPLAKAADTTAGKTAPAGAAAGATKPAGAAAGKTTAKTETKPKAPTLDDIRTRFGGYLSTKDTDLREVRKGHVQAINEHFGVAKVTDLDASLYAEALGYLTAYEAGETPEFAQADDDAGGDEDESLV